MGGIAGGFEFGTLLGESGGGVARIANRVGGIRGKKGRGRVEGERLAVRGAGVESACRGTDLSPET